MNKLLPYALDGLWRPVSGGCRRLHVHVDPSKLLLGTPEEGYHNGIAAESNVTDGVSNCLSSAVGRQGLLHMPMLDVDSERTDELDAQFRHLFNAPVHWVPSTNNWHVYIDVGPYEIGYRVMAWANLTMVLDVLANECLVDRGWTWYSRREGQCVLRKPGYKKVVTKPTWSTDWSCMWCSKGFATERALDEHEAHCG
jgi:hypothetical protein